MAWGQQIIVPASGPQYADFAPLLNRLRQRSLFEGETLTVPVLHRDGVLINGRKYAGSDLGVEIRLAEKSLGLPPREVALRNPFGTGYPLSYSVIYRECLVVLFEPGHFACFRLQGLARDEALERQLNSRKFSHHWLLDGQLVGRSEGRHYVFDLAKHTWQPYQQPVPFGEAPKLFEDKRYLVYADCQGEFGGNAYFFNRQTHQTHRVAATCATTVWQEQGKYRLLVSLGHMMGRAGCAAILDVEALPLASAPVNARQDWQYTFANSLPNPAVRPVFRLSGLQAFGGFRWQDQTLYYVRWRNATFLATIAKDRVTVVDPLFGSFLYTHRPVTTSYGPRLALTNLDFYGLGGTREVAALLLQGAQLTKIAWGEQPHE